MPGDPPPTTAWPFAFSTACCQQVIDAAVICQASSLITGLAYRRDEAPPATLQAQRPSSG